MQQNTIYYEWGTLDGRIKNHLMLKWQSKLPDGSFESQASHLFGIKKQNYMDFLIIMSRLSKKDLKEIDFYLSSKDSYVVLKQKKKIHDA